MNSQPPEKKLRRRFRRLWEHEPVKIIVPSFIAVILFVTAIFAIFLPAYKTGILERKKETIRELTQAAWNIMNEQDAAFKRGELTLKQAQDRAVDQIQMLRYGPENKDYFWINDMQPRMIMHPYRPDLNGRDISDYMDPDGKRLFVEFVKTVKKDGQGYVSYIWQWKDNPDLLVPKLSYVKGFAPWGWIVGTGIYLEDVREEITKITNKLTYISVAILFIVSFLTLYAGWIGYGISERKKGAERALLESERRFRAIFNQTFQFIGLLTTSGHVVAANDTSLDFYGTNQADVVGLPLWETPWWSHSEDMQDTLRRAVIKAAGGELVRFEATHYDSDGRDHIMDVSLKPALDEYHRIEYLIIEGRDVTERKQAENEVRASEKRFRDLFNSISDLVFTQDLDGRFLSVNPSLTNSLGYREEEIIGRPTSDFMLPEYREQFVTEYLEGIKSSGSYSGTTVYLTKDGDRRYIEYSSVISRPDSEVAFITGTGRDVTEKFQSEKEIKKLQRQMMQAQKMEAIGALAGGIAHDFNNILSAIVGYVELTAMQFQENENVASNLEQVMNACMRAKDLINQILSFSRRGEQELQPVDISSVVKETLRFLRSSVPTTIEFKTQIEANTGSVLADPTQIHQILMNLCANAYYAMRDAGGILSVSLEKIEIDEEHAGRFTNIKPGFHQRLTVADTGCGMDKETLDRIFEPFFTTKVKGEGTGLGLSVVYGIVKSYDGDIKVYSEPGRGSTISIYLPICDLAAEDVQMEPLPAIKGGSEHILYVDDEETLVEIGRQALEHIGYKVTCTTSSIDALRLFKCTPDEFDLVITDHTMPNLTGTALAREIFKVKPDLPVILCTGFSEALNAERAYKLGISAFFMKPVNLRELARIIRSLLDKSENQRPPETAR